MTYKIISKIIANRLKTIIGMLISPTPNAFIPGRLLADNYLIAHELIRELKNHTRGGEFLVALKIDMFKAYDKVSRKFLKWILHNTKFPLKFVQ